LSFILLALLLLVLAIGGWAVAPATRNIATSKDMTRDQVSVGRRSHAADTSPEGVS